MGEMRLTRRHGLMALVALLGANVLAVVGAAQVLGSGTLCEMRTNGSGSQANCVGECPTNFPNCGMAVTITGYIDPNTGLFVPVSVSGQCMCGDNSSPPVLVQPAVECVLKFTHPWGQPASKTYTCEQLICPNDCPTEPMHCES